MARGVQTYSFTDNQTGTDFSIDKMIGSGPPTEEEMMRTVRVRTQQSQRNLSSGDYMYENYNKKDNKLKGTSQTRAQQLEYDTALFLGVSPKDVDASSGILNFGDKSALSMRVNPQEKLDELQQRYGKDSVFVMDIGGKPRMMLDTKNKDNQPRYIFMDSEGFTASDFGDAVGQLPRVAVGVTALIAGSAGMLTPEPITGVAGWGLFSLGLGALDFTTKSFQDLAVGKYDRVTQNDADKQGYQDYVFDRLKNNAIESGTGVAIDLATLGAGKWLSSIKGFGPDDFAKSLIASQERLNKNFGREAGKIKLSRGAETDRAGAQFDINASKYSNAIKNLQTQNRDVVDRIMQALKSGDAGQMEQAIKLTSQNIRTNYEKLIKDIAKNDKALEAELNNALQRSLKKNGIDGFFDASVGGKANQGFLNKSFKSKTKIKNKKYENVGRLADEEGISYSAVDIVNEYKKAMKSISGGKLGTDEEQLLLGNLNSILGTKYKTLKILEKEVVKKKVLPSGVANLPKGQKALLPKSLQTKVPESKQIGISFNQLDSIIKRYADDANYAGISTDKTQAQIFAETFSNGLRDVRNRALLTKNKAGVYSSAKKGSKAGAQLLDANSYYNKSYLPFFNLFDGNIINKGKGYMHNGEFKMGGSTALDNILGSPDSIERYIKLLDPNDRSQAIDILRKRYMQNNGGDGVILINSGAQFKTDTNILRQLYGERNANGIITKDITKQIDSQIRNINKLAEQNPSRILSIDEKDMAMLLQASTPTQVKKIGDRILREQRLQIRAKRFHANQMVKKMIDDPEYTMQPEMFAEYLLQADKATLKMFQKHMKELPDTVTDSVRASVISQLEYMAKKNLDSAQYSSDKSIFNPNVMLSLLRDGSPILKNAEAILGKTVVRNIKDSANILKFSKETVQRDAGGRVVFSGGANTIVFNELFPAVMNKIYGRLATTPVLKKMFPRIKYYDDPLVVADRMSKVLPYMLASNDMGDALMRDATTNAQLLQFLQAEASTIGNIGRMQAMENQAMQTQNTVNRDMNNMNEMLTAPSGQ